MHTISNSFLQISVNSTGAELCSLISLASGKEYMWNADPAFWANFAPVLFPIVGGLKDGTYFHEGSEYSLPKHGFIRYNEQVALVKQTTNSLTFGLKYDEKSLLIYPFKFEFFITFLLDGNVLTISHKVLNHGTTDMLFSLGGHPAFRCPLHEGEVYSDYFLEFEQAELARTWDLNSSGEIAEEGRVVLDNSAILPLDDHLFDHDALIFKSLKSRAVHLKSHKSSQVLTMRYDGWPYFGVWAKPGAPFVCLEPWLGIADSADHDQQLAHKEAIQTLAAGGTFEAAYSVEIQE